MNDASIKTIKQAILNEYDAYEFYMQQSRQWHSETIVENFVGIAREELLHAKWLLDFFNETSEVLDKKLFNVMEGVRAPGIYDWSSIKRMASESERSVFQKAMDFELKAVEHYTRVLGDAESEEEVVIIKKIIEWEKIHYQQFKKVYESFE